MKTKWILSGLVILLIACLLAAGCLTGSTQENTTPKDLRVPKTPTSVPATTIPVKTTATKTAATTRIPPTTQSSSYDPLDYFPMTVGNEWSYSIEIGQEYPIAYEEIYVVQSQDIYTFPYRGPIQAKAGEKYGLVMRIKGPFRGGQRLMSVELSVADQLGLFRFADTVYWGIQDNPGGLSPLNAMLQAQEYSASKLEAVFGYPELRTATIIHSYRPIFIWGGSKLESEYESISYLGIDNDVPAFKGIPCYHFVRNVPPRYIAGTYGKAFTEDAWYAPNVGLVRLVQKVEGKTSMTWTLVSFEEA